MSTQSLSSIIDLITKTDSRLAKEALVREQAKAGNSDFFAGLRLAYDPTVTFGVKKVPVSTTGGSGLSWQEFKKLAEKLQSRELTGHDARDAIATAMAKSSISEWNGWYRLILLKDMKAGFSEGTINRVCEVDFPQYKVAVFECQLAKDCVDDDGNVDESELKGKKILDTKLDGCLSADWIVEFEDGTKVTLCEVVDNSLKGKIKSFNTLTGKVEFNEITGWAKNGQDDAVAEYEWFILTLENGTQLPPLTGNHLVYLPELKCYRRADLLTVNDVILSV